MDAPLPSDPASAEPPPQAGARVVYRAEVEARLDEVSRVCAEVAALAAERTDAATAGEIDLGLAEAMSNIARHGYPDGDPAGEGGPGTVQLVCVERPDGWSLRLFDRGRPIPEERLHPPDPDDAGNASANRAGDPSGLSPSPFDFDPACIEALPEGGMGLALLRASFDRIDYRSGARGNLLVLTKRFGRPAAS